VVLHEHLVTGGHDRAVALLEGRLLELGRDVTVGQRDGGLAALGEFDRGKALGRVLLLAPRGVRHDVDEVDDVDLAGRLRAGREGRHDAGAGRRAAEHLAQRALGRDLLRQLGAVGVAEGAELFPGLGAVRAEAEGDQVAGRDGIARALFDDGRLQLGDLEGCRERRRRLLPDLAFDRDRLGLGTGVDLRIAEVDGGAGRG
jgi:hypothetical protein